MKRKLSLVFLFVFIITTMFIFTGCEKTPIAIESLLKVDNDFAGQRLITFNFPKDLDVTKIKDLLYANAPKDEEGGYSINAIGSSDQGSKIEFAINFKSHKEYVDRVSKIIGREVSVNLAQPNTILTKGTRMYEDFDVKDLIKWATTIINENSTTKKMGYKYSSNLVNISGVIYTTETTIYIKDVIGHEIKDIVIETTNNKDGKYERRFIFTIPEKTYKELGSDLKEYFANNTENTAMYAQWIHKGSIYEYEVIYRNIDIEELITVTNKLLDVTDCDVYYGDKTNSSTPLSESLIFEEQMNLFSFIGPDKEPVTGKYIYYLPTETTKGEGSVFSKGVWEDAGKWENNTYNLDFNSSVLNIQISDGIQYKIEGINYFLVNKGKNNFVRTTDIIYSKESGKKGLEYGYNFLKSKDTDIIKKEEKERLICRLTIKGNAEEISKETQRIFGKGNTLEYYKSDNIFDIIHPTEIKDNININHMITKPNKEKPIKYTVVSEEKEEEIRSLKIKGSKYKDSSYKANKNNEFTVNIEKGNGEIKVLSGIHNFSGMVTYITLSAGLSLLAIGIVVMLNIKHKKKEKAERNRRLNAVSRNLPGENLSSLDQVMDDAEDNEKL